MPYIGNQPYQGVIDSGNILNGSIDTVDLKDGSVTSAKLETLAGLTANTYGSASAIPQITVDSKGRITAISTNTVSIPSGSISVTGGDITMSGNTGTAITNATIADGAVTAAKLASGSVTSAKLDTNITIAGALTVSGNLTVSGTTTTVNSTTLEVADLNVVLGRNATTAAAANGAGITIGNYASNPTILYGSTNNTFAINRGVEVAGGVNVSGSLSMVNTTNGIYGHYYSTVTNGNITFYNAYNNTDPRFIWYGGTGSNLTYHTSNLALYPGTDVGLNLGLSNFRWNNFYVNNITATSLTETSSILLKENFRSVKNPLSIVTKLVGHIYDRRDGSTKNEIGLVAEEVAAIAPNLVDMDSLGNPTSVKYSRLTVYLLEAIKIINHELEVLKETKVNRY